MVRAYGLGTVNILMIKGIVNEAGVEQRRFAICKRRKWHEKFVLIATARLVVGVDERK